MNKREADTILLACKKHGISLTMRKEGDVNLVIFINRIEIKCFEGAKLLISTKHQNTLLNLHLFSLIFFEKYFRIYGYANIFPIR